MGSGAVGDLTVLVVEHEPGAPAGWLGEELEAAGATLDVRRPWTGQPLQVPDDLSGIDAVLVLGGAMAAWDAVVAPWLLDTRSLVSAAERAGVPVLGVCLGHQLATRALGGEVGRNPAGTSVAVLPVRWMPYAARDPLFSAMTDTALAVHWNDDAVSALPPGATVLATSPDGAVQAARLGTHVWGVQFHPEAGPSIIDRWVREDGAPYVAAGFDLEQYTRDVADHEPELRDSCRRLAASFLSLVWA
jgi:GMP synthase (glutamine-hydrolysing)